MKKKKASSSLTTLTVRPGPGDRTVTDANGKVLAVPKSWDLLPPGDATLTRRVKAATDHWLVQNRRGRRVFSEGIWADAAVIQTLREELIQHRQTPQYAKSQKAAAKRRDKVQTEYVGDFSGAVRQFLNFDSRHREIAEVVVEAVTRHATPVGSGTVARTKRIPIERRAEAAVIAWMRHQTTAYDDMSIPRVKGKRREVRRMLAAQSKHLLSRYRGGLAIAKDCPLAIAATKISAAAKSN